MNDAEALRLEAQVQALRDKWVEPLGIGNWRIALHFYRDGGEFQQARGVNAITIASCDCKWEYQGATLYFSLPQLAAESESEMEETVVHELCHLLLAEVQMCMDEDAMHHLEHTTTMLARAFVWVRKAGEKEEP